MATSCEELTHWKRLWCWEGLGAGGEGDYRGWDDWMASPTQWTWVWVNSGILWWTGRPGMLQFMGSLNWSWLSNWTELIILFMGMSVSYRQIFEYIYINDVGIKIKVEWKMALELMQYKLRLCQNKDRWLSTFLKHFS